MAKYQFNKTAMLQIEKDLKIRYQALPVLEAKEAALRAEIKKLGDKIARMEGLLKELLERHSSMNGLWTEMPDIIRVKKVSMSQRLVAGIKVPLIKNIEYEEKPYSIFSLSAWIPGVTVLEQETLLKDLRQKSRLPLSALILSLLGRLIFPERLYHLRFGNG